MAYEKYIKKDGKLYGPYIYHSKRVDGKVVSEYHGQKRTDIAKFLWIIPLIILVIFGAYLIGQSGKIATGYSILDLNANYQAGQTLTGEVKISLQQGEFIPAASAVIFENAGKKYEYLLGDLVSEQTAEGNFFLKEKNISGFGFGFGLAGTKEIYPEVQFILLVYSKANETENTESETEISGTVSAGNDFTYALQEGERAELKPRSVKTNSSQLSENDVSLTIGGTLVSISTNYSEKEEGFGSDYIGEKIKEFSVNLNELNLLLEPGQLKAGIFYAEEKLISLETTIESEGETEISTPEVQIQTETQTQIETTQPETTLPTLNETQNKTQIPIQEEIELTEEERAVLLQEFGDLSVEQEAKLRDNRIIVRYEIGEHWIEHSYSSNMDNETLNAFMKTDRVKWLKDIAQRLSQDETPEEKPFEGVPKVASD